MIENRIQALEEAILGLLEREQKLLKQHLEIIQVLTMIKERFLQKEASDD